MLNAVKAVVDQKVAEKKDIRDRSAAARARATRKPKMQRIVAALLSVVFVASLVPAIARWNQPFSPPSGAAAEREAREAIVFTANLVDEYVRSRGGPPASLSDLGVELPGVRYAQVAGAWTLSMSVDGRTVSFRSGDDPQRFLNNQ